MPSGERFEHALGQKRLVSTSQKQEGRAKCDGAFLRQKQPANVLLAANRKVLFCST